MIGAAQYALMLPTPRSSVTAARGFIHDEMALAEALKANTRDRRRRPRRMV